MAQRGFESRYTVSLENERLIEAMVNDFKIGKNVSVATGGRTEATLRKNRYRMLAICHFAENNFGLKDISKITEDQILTIFEQMQKGKIKTQAGKIFTSVESYQATFKAFWNWFMKKERRENSREIPNVVQDIIAKRKQPEFVYFTIDDLTKMEKLAKHDYRVLMWFLFDSGVRPEEMKELLCEDISFNSNDSVVTLTVRNHVAKKGSFGRKIKLMLCKDLIRDWIKEKKGSELLFPLHPHVVNQYLGRISEKVIGKRITMYDFRHNSCCYWMNIYKKDQALKYRFGWKKSEMIEYYSRYIGLQDDVTENDLVSEEVRTKMEKDISKLQTQLTLKDEEHHAELEDLKRRFDLVLGELSKRVVQSGEAREILERVKAVGNM